MDRFFKLSLGTQALLILLLPLAGLAWFTADNVTRAKNVMSASERQILFTEIAASAGAVVHETQKERGLTSGALGADGAEFAAKLPEQRTVRDVRISELKALVADIDTDTLGPVISGVLERALSYTDPIADMRRRVDAQSVDQATAVNFYIEVVGCYLELVSNMPKLSEDREVATLGDAYTALLRVKEASGLERNVLSETFARNELTSPLRQELLQLVTTQTVYRSELMGSLSGNFKDMIGAELDSQPITNAHAMRNVALNSAVGRNFNIDPLAWFQVQSLKLDQLKQIEEQMLKELKSISISRRDEAAAGMRSAMIVGALAGLTVLFAIGWNIVKFKGLQRDLGGDANYLNEVLAALGQGDFSMDLSTEKPATGVYAGLQSMKSKLEAQVEKDRQVVAESNRIRQALDNVDSPVIIANETMHVVFVNRAAKSLFDQFNSDQSYQGQPVDSAHLVGVDIAQIPGLSQSAKNRLVDLNKTHIDDTDIGSRTVRLVSNPVFSDNGDRLGAIVVWNDRTAEVSIERDVDSVVQSARGGDLTQRINTKGMEGFYASLSEGVNSLLTVAEQVVGDTVRVFSAIARGSLKESIDREYQGSYGRLKSDANATIHKLTEVIGSIQESASSVKGGAHEIAIGNADLQQRTEEQASGLEKTAENMKHLTEMVRQSASNASEANELAQGTRNLAHRGGEAVNNTVSAMQEINEASRRIADIIAVIDEIAFQTNLLALNAAVEAARAGEQGRGFAVVATEVRNLAGRSASAAKEIKSLIQDSTSKVEEGTRLVDASGKTLEEIVTEVQRLSTTVEEIAQSSQEQYQGIDQVNATISQLDAFTQQNAAMVEEASAASESLGAQAARLDELAAFFETASDTSARAAIESMGVSIREERRSGERPWSEAASV
ncbi:MAG: methyl-accepting chemotaxis protein [Pseudomonadota bacterium]